MAIIHIVLFKLKPTLGAAGVKKVCDEMLTLQFDCVHPQSREPYIVSISGGVDNSPEGLQGGFTHGFVVEFASARDRDYYVTDDPIHKAFVTKNSDKFDDVRVLDYEKWVY